VIRRATSWNHIITKVLLAGALGKWGSLSLLVLSMHRMRNQDSRRRADLGRLRCFFFLVRSGVGGEEIVDQIYKGLEGLIRVLQLFFHSSQDTE
jgi:hypothetical protein